MESTELFKFQKEGVAFLKNKKYAILASQMGLGKSAQAIVAAHELGFKSLIIFCPAIARYTWMREIQKFGDDSTPDICIIANGKTPPLENGITICSYELADKIKRYPVDIMILDESHYLKSADAKRTKAIFGSAAKNDGWIHHVGRCWALSGTPAPNHFGEMWTTLFTFGVTKLPYRSFVERYCNVIHMPPYGIRITGSKVERSLEMKRLLSNIMIRHLKEDVLQDLPPKIYGDVIVQPGKIDIDAELLKKSEQEQALVKQAMDQGIDGEIALEGIAGSVATLRRITGLKKVEPVAHLIKEELESKLYEKIVIFGIHRDVLLGLDDLLVDLNPVLVVGGMSDKEKQHSVSEFQNNPECKIFIGNITAAGTNITLTASSNVIFIEPDWVPGNNAQAADRCHRIGTKAECVNIRFVSLVDSLDFRITETLIRKTKELTKIFDV